MLQKIIWAHLASFVNNAAQPHERIPSHVDYYFDYLRQAIVCAADLTMEKARVDPDGRRRAADGWGTI